MAVVFDHRTGHLQLVSGQAVRKLHFQVQFALELSRRARDLFGAAQVLSAAPFHPLISAHSITRDATLPAVRALHPPILQDESGAHRHALRPRQCCHACFIKIRHDYAAIIIIIIIGAQI